jgi:hypothetical protein
VQARTTRRQVTTASSVSSTSLATHQLQIASMVNSSR